MLKPPFKMFAIIDRLDETLKTLNNEPMSKSPKYSKSEGGRLNKRDLVNPNIMQSAPEVGCYDTYTLINHDIQTIDMNNIIFLNYITIFLLTTLGPEIHVDALLPIKPTQTP